MRGIGKRIAMGLALLALFGCGQDMSDQPYVEPYESSRYFADGRGSRSPVANTVSREDGKSGETLRTGRRFGEFVESNPLSLTEELLERGRERYQIFCSVCHGEDGYGDGAIIERGFPIPPSFHSDRLREASDGHLYDAIRNGYGVMYSYRSRIPIKERWAIVAYLRALQLSSRMPEAWISSEADKEVVP